MEGKKKVFTVNSLCLKLVILKVWLLNQQQQHHPLVTEMRIPVFYLDPLTQVLGGGRLWRGCSPPIGLKKPPCNSNECSSLKITVCSAQNLVL